MIIMLHSLKTITDKVVVRIMAPQRYPPSNPWNLRMCYSPCYKGFAGVIKSRILRWSYGPDYPGGPNVLTCEKEAGEVTVSTETQLEWSEKGGP